MKHDSNSCETVDTSATKLQSFPSSLEDATASFKVELVSWCITIVTIVLSNKTRSNPKLVQITANSNGGGWVGGVCLRDASDTRGVGGWVGSDQRTSSVVFAGETHPIYTRDTGRVRVRVYTRDMMKS